MVTKSCWWGYVLEKSKRTGLILRALPDEDDFTALAAELAGAAPRVAVPAASAVERRSFKCQDVTPLLL